MKNYIGLCLAGGVVLAAFKIGYDIGRTEGEMQMHIGKIVDCMSKIEPAIKSLKIELDNIKATKAASS